MLWAW